VVGQHTDAAAAAASHDFAVLFVCMGNICRSPTAEAVFRRLVATAGGGLRVHVDSAGTHAYHVGDPPDRRAQAAGARRGYDLSAVRARQLAPGDFERFDFVLFMDERNRRDAARILPVMPRAHVALLLDFAAEAGHREVPDPYYGGPQQFEEVLDLIEAAARGLLTELARRHGR
jgi:protein-tyrosine phosphatase